MTVDIATLGIKVENNADKAARDLDSLASSGRRAEEQTDRLASQTDALRKLYKDLAGAMAAWKLYDMIRDATMLAARYETLGVAMMAVGRNAGYGSEQLNATVDALRETGISMVEARQQSINLMQSQIDLANATKLARIAQDAAVIGNINSSDAFARLVHGIKTGQTDVLRGIGINVDMEASYQKLAHSLGISTQAMSQQQKMQAVLNAVLREGEAIAGTYEAAMGTAGKQLNSMKRYIEDLSVKVGGGFLEAFTAGVFGAADGFKAANKQLDELASSGKVEKFGADIADAAVALIDGGKAVWEYRQAIEALAAAFVAIKIGQTLGPAITAAASFVSARVAATSAVVASIIADRDAAVSEVQLAISTREAAAASVARSAATLAELTATRAMAQEAMIYGAQRAALEREVTAATLAHTAASTALAAADARLVVANEAVAASTLAAGTATRAAGAASGLAGAAITALGGPVGALITVLGLAAAAWYAFGDAGTNAIDDMLPNVDDLERRVSRLKKTLTFGSGDRGEAIANLTALNEAMAKAQKAFQASDEFLAKNNPEYAKLIAAREKVIEQLTLLAKLENETVSAPKKQDDPDYEKIKAAAKAYKEFRESIAEKMAIQTQEAELGRKMSESEKLEVELKSKLNLLIKEHGSRLADVTKKEIESLVAKTHRNELDERWAELNKKMAEQEGQKVDQLQSEINALKQQNQEIGLTKEQLNALVLARQDNAIAMAEEKYRMTELTDENVGYLSNLASEIRYLRERRAEISNGQNLQRLADQTKAATDEIAGMARSAEDVMHRAFIDWTSGAENASERMWKALKTGFFDLLWNAAAKPVIVNLVAQTLGGNVAASAFGNGVAGSAIGNSITGSGIAGSLGFGGGISGLYGAYMSGVSEAALGASFVGPSASLANGAMGFSGSLGSTAASSFGSTIASALPWIGGALALASAFGLFDSKGGPKISGQGLAVFGDNGQFTTPDTWNISNPTTKPGRWYGTQVWDGAANTQFQGAMDTFATGVASYLSRIGLDTKGLSFGLGGDTDPQGTAGDFVRAAVVRNGAEVYSREYEAERGKGQEAVQLELQRMLLATVKSAGDSLYTDAIGSLDIANATADQLTAKLNEIEAIHNVVSSLGDAYTKTLAEQAGGIANLSALVTSYNQAAYTDVEKQKQQSDALAGVFESLGLSVPATMEEYRKLVEAQDTLTESGAAARVQLMGVAAAMAEEAKRAEALANQKRDMEIQILELEGKAVEATALKRQAELAALDESLRPLQERIYALQDEQGAVAQATQSAAAFVETMNRYAMGMEKGRDILTPSADAIGALSGGDYGKTLQMQQEYLQNTLADLQAQLRNATDFRQYDYLTGQIGGVEDVLARVRSEYERYMSFETQNPGHGQALMELENWYNAQKALADHNASALALIEAAYWQKRQDILASATDAERSQLETWLRNLEQGPQSPLSPQAQYEAAAKRYADMMASGDMSHYTEYADAYLKAAEAMYGHGGDYTAIYNEIVANARDQIDGEMRANDHRVEQIAETRTTNNELRLLRAEVAQMRMDMGRATERTGSLTRNELINATRAIIDGANKQAAATERASQLAKTQ